MSENISNGQLNNSNVKEIFGVHCYNGIYTDRQKLSTTPVTLELFHYKWKLTYNRKKDDNKKLFIITAEPCHRYTFDDKHLLNVRISKGRNKFLDKVFTLDKLLGKQEFEIEYLESCSVSFKKLRVKARLFVEDMKYYQCNFGSEYNFEHANRPHDVVLVVEERKFYLFRNYLATWSKYFDRLFFGDFKEKNQYEIKLDEVDAGEFRHILSLIHPSLLDILCDKCKDLELLDRLELADNYNLVPLQIMCFERIHKMEEKERAKFFEQNRLRIQQLSCNTIKNLV